LAGLERSSGAAKKELLAITGDDHNSIPNKIFNGKYPKEIHDRVLSLAKKSEAYNDFVAGLEEFPAAYSSDLARSGKIKEVTLDMENPYVHDMGGEPFRDVSYKDIIKKAKERGHDGVIIKNTYDGGNPVADLELTDVHVAFNKSQIKPVQSDLAKPSNRIEPGKQNIVSEYDVALGHVSKGGTLATKELLAEAITKEPNKVIRLQDKIRTDYGNTVTLYRNTR
jgi:hypothetical protein